jgi:biotin operon repressor
MATDQSIKLHSLLNILKALNTGSTLTPAQLARSLEVTERSVYRYITTLQGAGYPIYFDRKINSYCFSDGFRLSEQKKNNELIQALDIKSVGCWLVIVQPSWQMHRRQRGRRCHRRLQQGTASGTELYCTGLLAGLRPVITGKIRYDFGNRR